MKQKEEILRKRISLQRLPSQMNRMISQIKTLVGNTIDKDKRVDLSSRCSKLVTQYQFDLLYFNLQIIEDIQDKYQKELSELNWTDSVKQAIIERQNKIVERHELYLTQKLDTIFRRSSDSVKSKKQHGHHRSKIHVNRTTIALSPSVEVNLDLASR